MFAYLDASALLKLCVRESGSVLVERIWDGADAVAASRLSDAEVRATLRAAGRAGLLDDVDGALTAWERLRPGLRMVDATRAIAERAAELTARPIRAADALQLASALLLAPTATFVCFDRRLAAAAQLEGLDILPRIQL